MVSCLAMSLLRGKMATTLQPCPQFRSLPPLGTAAFGITVCTRHLVKLDVLASYVAVNTRNKVNDFRISHISLVTSGLCYPVARIQLGGQKPFPFRVLLNQAHSGIRSGEDNWAPMTHKGGAEGKGEPKEAPLA